MRHYRHYLLAYAAIIGFTGSASQAKPSHSPHHPWNHPYKKSPAIKLVPSRPSNIIVAPGANISEVCHKHMPPGIAKKGLHARMRWLKGCRYDIQHYGKIIIR